MAEVGSEVLPPDRQGEVSHRYYLGLYSLLERLTQSFPEVLFESCSGGGGRFDAGMLYYMPQTWTSDNSDAIERLKIQYGTPGFTPCPQFPPMFPLPQPSDRPLTLQPALP